MSRPSAAGHPGCDPCGPGAWPGWGRCCSGRCPRSPQCSPCRDNKGLLFHQEAQQSPAHSGSQLEPEIGVALASPPIRTFTLSLFQQSWTVPGAGSEAGWLKGAGGVAGQRCHRHQQGSDVPPALPRSELCGSSPMGAGPNLHPHPSLQHSAPRLQERSLSINLPAHMGKFPVLSVMQN